MNNTEFEFTGKIAVQIVGAGVVQLHRSIKDGPFYPMTDEAGEIVEFAGTSKDDVVFNDELDNDIKNCKFKWVVVGADAPEIVMAGKDYAKK